MEYKEIYLKNFLSYQDQSFTFSDNGLTLIEGYNKDEGDSNGAGKSSLWDGISWAMFGQTVRGLKGDDVINRKFKKDCLVTVKLTCFGKNYEVTRCRKHSELGDRLFINNEGEKVELGTIAQTQQWILDTFQIDFDLFRCTVLFAQGETFNFVDAGNKAQKEILSKVMKINYDKFLTNTKTKIKTLSQSIQNAERELISIEARMDVDFEEIEEKIRQWDEGREERLTRLRAEIEKYNKELDELKAKSKPTDKINSMLKRVQADIKAKRMGVGDLEEECGELKVKLHYYESELKKGEELEGQEECPKCRSKITCLNQEWIQDSKNNIDKYKVLVKSKNDEIKEIRNDIEDMSEKLEKLRTLLSQQESLQKQIGMIESRVESLDQDYSNKESEENPYRDELDRKKKLVESLTAQAKEKETEIVNYNKLMPFYDFWINAFGDSGIKSFVFDLICSNLTNKANGYLNILSGGAFAISFDTQKLTKSGELREKFDCVVSKDDQKVDYASCSGGEKRRISLAVDMALSEIMGDYHGSKFNVVCFDEQSNFLDKHGREYYMNLLKSMSKEKQVFVVDHDSEFKSRFDRVITIEKSGGISRVIL
jgi:DNA repair exonuclease SbcCD ATPase subunit